MLDVEGEEWETTSERSLVPMMESAIVMSRLRCVVTNIEEAQNEMVCFSSTIFPNEFFAADRWTHRVDC